MSKSAERSSALVKILFMASPLSAAVLLGQIVVGLVDRLPIVFETIKTVGLTFQFQGSFARSEWIIVRRRYSCGILQSERAGRLNCDPINFGLDRGQFGERRGIEGSEDHVVLLAAGRGPG